MGHSVYLKVYIFINNHVCEQWTAYSKNRIGFFLEFLARTEEKKRVELVNCMSE